MPTYQYACTECGHDFEQVQSFAEDSLTTCPVCQGRLRKVFNAVGVVFKGSGFYRNDSRGSTVGSEKSGSEKSGSTETSGSGTSGASSTSGTGSSGSSGSEKSGSGAPASSGGSEKKSSGSGTSSSSSSS